MKNTWPEIVENLKKMLNPGIFKVWIAPLRARVEGSRLLLMVPNAFVARWFERKMLPALRQAAAPVLDVEPAQVDVSVVVAAEGGDTVERDAMAEHSGVEERSPVPAEARQPRPRQIPLPTVAAPARSFAAHWNYSFADFVTGPSNNMAMAAAREVSRSDGRVRTLFLSSAPGLGKTHLAQSVGRALAEECRGARVAYLTAEEFASRFVRALQARDVEAFKNRFRDLDVLLLEDVHFFQGKEKMQEMALTIVKQLQARGGKAVFTSSFSPRELRHVDSQLVSCFCSDILTDIGHPTEDMRRHILENKAKSFQVLLPEPVSTLLAQRLRGDIRQLESCLNSLIFKARLLNCGVNLDLAREVLGQYTQVATAPDLPTIVRLVCESLGLSEDQLCSRSRRKEYVLGRNTVYYLARKHTDLTLEEIGGKFNRRHSTVIKGITSVERELSRDTSLGRQIAKTVGLIERNAGVRV